MNDLLLKLFRFKQWPPVMIPFVFIIIVILSPFYFSIPIIKWLSGRWECYICERKYGPTTKRINVYTGMETYYYECEHCQLAKRLEKSK